MRAFLPDRPTLRRTVRLTVPMVVVQVGLMAMGVTDTVMAGHLSATVLAGVALGSLFTFAILISSMGFLMALDPVIAQAVGAGDRDAVTIGLQRGLLLAGALTLPAAAAMLPGTALLNLAGQPADVARAAGDYALATIPGVLPMLVFTVLRQTLQAMHKLRPIVITTLAANVLNVYLNWVLMYGHLGFPPLGVEGAAWASTLGRWFMTAGVAALAWPVLAPHVRRKHPLTTDPRPLGRMLWIGLPIGAHMMLEFGAFGTIALLMGNLGTTAIAAHQVAINLASLTFMVPLGVSGAAAVLVGQAIGSGDSAGARRAAGAGLALGVGFMTLSASMFLTIPSLLAQAYTNVPEVAALAATLIPIAGAFQVLDGVQVVSSGVLRGAADTRVPMVISIAGFWCLGLPVSLWLAFATDLGPRGLWWGLTAGISVVALLLLARLRSHLARDVDRVRIDAPSPVS